MADALRIENLVVRFQTQIGQVDALNGVNLVMEEGQVYCLVGESGSGKSTLALSIMGVLPSNATIEKGAIYFDGVDLLRSGSEHLRKLRGKDIAMVFQDAQSALNPILLIGDQLVKEVGGFQVLQIHDELLFESSEDYVEQLRTVVCEEMEGAIELDVPLRVDIGVGKSWYLSKGG